MNPALNLKEWSLSARSLALLKKEPEITAAVAIARQQLPFPAGYTPAIVEVLFDDVPFIRSRRGQIVFLRPCPPNYQPPFVEVRFDDQMALFLIRGDVVVNRTQAIATLDQVLGRLTLDPTPSGD